MLAVHVLPRASRNEISGMQGNELKVRLTSPPVDGAANRLCEDFFAKILAVARSRVTIAAGARSRHKKLRIEDMSAEEVSAVLRPYLDNRTEGQ